jgi:hypothetical protein
VTLLEEILPASDIAASYRTLVRAAPAVVYEALWSADIRGLPLTRLLMGVRGIPARLRGHRPAVDRSGTLRDLVRGGFALLAERRGDEVVLGTIGRFWRPRGELWPATLADFSSALPSGLARAAWNFRVVEAGREQTELSTETRVECADAAARRRFRLYWMIIGPASGWIRREMLRAVRRQAERVRDVAERQSAV